MLGKQKIRETLLIFDHLYGLMYNGKVEENKQMISQGETWIKENPEDYKALVSARQDIFISDRELIALALALDL